MTIDNPSDMRELAEKSGESSKEAQDLSVHDRSKTLGDIEGSASTPWKVCFIHVYCNLLQLLVHHNVQNQCNLMH